jgi:hypothetical protein
MRAELIPDPSMTVSLEHRLSYVWARDMPCLHRSSILKALCQTFYVFVRVRVCILTVLDSLQPCIPHSARSVFRRGFAVRELSAAAELRSVDVDPMSL